MNRYFFVSVSYANTSKSGTQNFSMVNNKGFYPTNKEIKDLVVKDYGYQNIVVLSIVEQTKEESERFWSED